MSKNKVMRKLTMAVVAALMFTGVFAMVAAAAPKLVKSEATIAVGETVKAKVKNGKTTGKWKVKNAKIAKIKKKTKTYATIVGLKAGKTTMTVKSGKDTLKFTVTVKEAPKLNVKKLALKVGAKKKLKIKGTAKKVKWKSSATKIATVTPAKNGMSAIVKAVSAGKATITAKAGKKTVKCVVTVNGTRTTTSVTKKTESSTVTADTTDESKTPTLVAP